MGGLCLLLVALSAVAPAQGMNWKAGTTQMRDGISNFSSSTTPTEMTGPPNTLTGNTSVTPGPGALRLAGGRSRCEGRVELEQEGTWGTVCDDGWDIPDADVVCRQLRCGHAVRAPGSAAFGHGEGPILRDEVGCEGHELHLWECPATTEHDCSHKEDAGVVCSEHQDWRLSGGRDGCAGRVEVFFRGTWSTVCDSTWYELEAAVLCRTLGCGNVLQRPSFRHTLPGKMLYQCGILQPSLAQCHWTFNKSAPCHQSQAAGVICNGSQGLEMPMPTAEVTMRNTTVLHAEEGTPALGTAPLDSPLFVLCLVLVALLLLSMLAFSAALLRLRKRSAMSSLGIPMPVLVTHSSQSPNTPSGISNDYRETPLSLPKGSDPLVTAISKDSDSDSEYYEFSSKPPVTLSTFYSEHPTPSGIPDSLSRDPCHPGYLHRSPLPADSLRRHPREDLLPLRPNQDRMEPFPEDAPASPGPPFHGSCSSSSSSSTEPYWNGSVPPPAHGTHWNPSATGHGFGTVPPAAPAPVPSQPWVPAAPADPDTNSSSSTSSGEWYENVQDTESPGDPTSHPGWLDPSCPSGGHVEDPDFSEGSDYDDIQGSAY